MGRVASLLLFFPPSKSLKMRRISQQLPLRRFVLGLKSCFGNCEKERKNPPMGIGTSSYVTRHLFLCFFLFLLFVFLRRRGRKESSVSLTKQPSVYLPDRQAMSTSFSKSVCGEGGTERDKMSNSYTAYKRNLFFFFVDDRREERSSQHPCVPLVLTAPRKPTVATSALLGLFEY